MPSGEDVVTCDFAAGRLLQSHTDKDGELVSEAKQLISDAIDADLELYTSLLYKNTLEETFVVPGGATLANPS
jgi:hypothetical protein